MSQQSADFNLHQPEPLLIVISGPSGVGKDAVVQWLKKSRLPVHFVVTATTRKPRPTEVHGVDYFFYSMEEFQRMIDENELLEYALVYGDYKGIPKEQVRQALASGKDVILRIDVQGAATIRKLCPEAVLIFLTTASEEELVARLRARKTESPEELKTRLEIARQELACARDFDYVVLNREGELERTGAVIEAIITAEHHRMPHRKVSL